MVLMPHILVNPGTKPSLPYKRGNPTLEPATASVERGSAGGGPCLKRAAGHVLPWTRQLVGGLRAAAVCGRDQRGLSPLEPWGPVAGQGTGKGSAADRSAGLGAGPPGAGSA